MAIYAKPPGRFRYPTLAAPMGLFQLFGRYNKCHLFVAACDIPHRCLSAAKVRKLFETSKLFGDYFML